MRYTKSVYRGFEAILATIGGIIAFAASSFVIFIGSFTEALTLSLGTVSIIGAVLGILAGWYSFRDDKVAGVVLIISAILVLFGSSIFGLIGAVFLLVAGILDLFRN